MQIVLLQSASDPSQHDFASYLRRANQPVEIHELVISPRDRGGCESWLDQFIADLLTGKIDVAVFMTANGVRTLVETAAQFTDRTRVLNGLQDCRLVSASEVTTEAMKSLGLTAKTTSHQSTTWRETLRWLETEIELPQKRIALQSTLQDQGLIAGLEARGAHVSKICDRPGFNQNLRDRILAALPAESTVLILASPDSAEHFCDAMGHSGNAPLTKQVKEHHIVVCLGEETADCLKQNSIHVDHVSHRDWQSESPDDLVTKLETLTARKQAFLMNMSGPNAPANDTNAPWYNNPFMKACRGEPTDVTPVWMMRQAGRYMSEYREVRDKVSFLELCANPQLCSEVMCTAVNRLGVDVAIIFSDLLPILVPMGLDLEFVKGDGPVIHNPVRCAADLDRIKPLENNDELQFVMDTVTQTRADLPADMPLIGFSGAPFTLASYMIEGGGSRNYAHAKSLMFGDSGAWKELMQRLTDSIVIYLQGQIDAGAQCVQLFDSWAGCLNVQHYRDYVLPYVQQIIDRLPEEVPVINFGTGNPALLPLYAETKASVIGIDWRVRLDEAWETVGHDRAVQGNLDPTILLTDPETIRKHVKMVLDQAAGRPGHIFNLGHGILPMTPVDNAIALVDAVHELSQR